MTKQMLEIIFFLLVRFLLLLFDFLKPLSLGVLLYAERIMRWLLQSFFAEVTLVVGLVHLLTFRLTKNAFIKLHVVYWPAIPPG